MLPVQQIVEANSGTWWSRIWHGRKIRRDMTCSFCGRPSVQVAKLIAGPKVYICDTCVATADQALGGTPKEPAGRARMDPVPAASETRCSFCARKPRKALRLVSSRDKRVCEECLNLCRRILDDRTQTA